MPSLLHYYVRRPPTCRKPIKWSVYRGGCRLSPGHKGDCKPKSGKR